MSTEEEYPDETTAAINDILATLDLTQGVQDVADTFRPEYRSVAEAAAMATEDNPTLPAHHLGWSTVRLSYLGAEVPRAYENAEDIVIDDTDITAEAGAMFGELADEMLQQAGRTVSDDMHDLLVRHISGGMVAALEAGSGVGQPSDTEAVRSFLGMVQAGLHDGSLLRGLEAALEVRAIAPEPTRKQGILGKLQGKWEMLAAAAQRNAERQVQLHQLAERSREQGSLELGDLQPGDEITLTMSADNYEPADQIEKKGDPLTFVRTIRGKVEAIGERQFSTKMRGKQGVVVRIIDESRNGNDLHFTDEPLEPGAAIVLFGTESTGTVFHSYEDLPIIGDELAQGYPPILIDKDGFPAEMQVCNLGGYASMGLTQMTVNGQAMFHEGWRAPANSESDNSFSDEDW